MSYEYRYGMMDPARIAAKTEKLNHFNGNTHKKLINAKSTLK